MLLFVFLTLLPAVLAAPSKRAVPAPLVRLSERADVVANKYIVKLKDNSASVDGALSSIAVAPEHTFEHVFKGFSGELSEEALETLRNHPDVDYIEEDAVASHDVFVEQSGAPWGLGRIAHREKGSTTYAYDESAGEGTCAYIIDSGVAVEHPEFEGRATFVVNVIDDTDTDRYGHGTHVAGTVASKSYGVAKKAHILAVKVLDNNGGGTTSTLIAGLEFVVGDAPTREGCPKGFVANMSLRSSVSAALNAAAAALPAADVLLAVSAGNSNTDSTSQSPAAEPSVCTIGASDVADVKSTFSNYGPGVDVFAPGTAVLSTYPGNTTNTLSGTSMATPHIAGLAAYLGSLEGLRGDVLCVRIKELATVGALTGLPSGTSNLLAFNGNPST